MVLDFSGDVGLVGGFCYADVSQYMKDEFQFTDFGDKRLDDRLQRIGVALGGAPSESIPRACGDWASTKATLMRNSPHKKDMVDYSVVNRMTLESRLRSGLLRHTLIGGQSHSLVIRHGTPIIPRESKLQ